MMKQFNETNKTYATVANAQKAITKAEEANPGLDKITWLPTINDDGRYVPVFLISVDRDFYPWFHTILEAGFCVMAR